MAVENFEQILSSINNSEIRIALEKLFALAGIGAGSDGSSLSQDVIGDLTGNVTGNVTGDVTGDLTGAVTGDVTGDVAGDVTADIVKGNVTTYAADADLDGVVLTNFIEVAANAATVNLTNAELQLGAMYTFYCSRADQVTTITLKSPGTFDGVNNKITFDEEDAISVFATAAGIFLILANSGVALSSV